LINIKDPKQLSKWLADAISVELSKPEDDIDMDFIDECQSLINILMNTPEYTDEEIETRFNRIITKTTAIENKIKPKNKFRFRFKSVLVASIIVFVVFGFSLGLFAFKPAFLRNIINTFFEVGQTMEKDGITYTYLGENKNYDSVESFIESEGLDIEFPEILPEGVQLERIIKPEIDYVIFIFKDRAASFEILFNNPVDPSTYDYHDTYENKHTFYLVSKADANLAYANRNGNLYSINCSSKEALISFISGFDFEN